MGNKVSFVKAWQPLNDIQLVNYWGDRGKGEGTIKHPFFSRLSFFCDLKPKIFRCITFFAVCRILFYIMA